MFEDIQKHRQAVQENMEKAFEIGFTGNEDLEKAHQVGDIHPNGKWVWTQLPSGKFDWRVIKLDKPGGNRALNQISDKQRQTYEEIENLINHGKRLTTAQANFYNNLKPSMDKLKKQASASQSQKTEEGKEVEVDKNSSSKQADDIVLTNEDYDRVFHNVGLSRQTLFEHNNKPYILKIFGKHFDGSYLISVHNGDTGKKLQGDSNIAISVRRAFINQLKQEKLRDIERNAKKKQVSESKDVTQKNSDVDAKVKPSSKKNPSELKTISEVEDYAKGIDGVTFKNVESGWGDKRAKAFELTYPHGGKMIVDFLHNGEYVYELTDSKGNPVISTNSTDETALTDWSFRLNPDKIVSRSIEVLKTKLTKLKGEETKARNKMIRSYSSFSDKYAYQKASEAVSDMKTKIQKLQSLIGTF